MKDLTLIIPAKNEPESLPSVLEEIKDFNCEKIIILESSDTETINSIKKFNYQLVYQSGKGYGDALIDGINNVKTDFLCIYNADGSFDPRELKQMLSLCKNNYDLIFASRYMKNSGSEDDTFLTMIGNFIFTLIGKIFFSVKISDILYTFLLGRTLSFKKLNLKSKDFCLCVEMPIKAQRLKMNYIDTPSNERKRIAGKKKVNEFSDGFKILTYMIKSFFKLVD